MKLQHFMLGLLLASVMITGISLFINDQTVNTGQNINTTISPTLNQTANLMAQSQQQTATSRDTEITTTGTFALQTSGYSTLLQLWNSYGVAANMTTQASKELDIPPYITDYILTVVSLLLMFAILAAIYFGRTP